MQRLMNFRTGVGSEGGLGSGEVSGEAFGKTKGCVCISVWVRGGSLSVCTNMYKNRWADFQQSPLCLASARCVQAPL